MLEVKRDLLSKSSQDGAKNLTIAARLTLETTPMRLVALIVALSFCAGLHAELEPEDAGAVFVRGMRAYDKDQYAQAVQLFESVLELQPTCARCANMLGKSYGGLAEQADWLDAIKLAKKTRLALEHAVALAPNDRDAIRDLIKYYRAAPSFLGGSDEKAEALEQRLRQFESDATG
jgi:tetratricopeptide (TPR) repeat protein